MSSKRSGKDFKQVLDALGNDVDADNIGAVHAFFGSKPDSYELDEKDLNYLEARGIEGLDNLASCANYFTDLKESDKGKFVHLANNYSEIRLDIERVMTPANRGFSVSQASCSRTSAGAMASQLSRAGLAEKRGEKRTYRMTGDVEDYRMVEHVINKLNGVMEE